MTTSALDPRRCAAVGIAAAVLGVLTTPVVGAFGGADALAAAFAPVLLGAVAVAAGVLLARLADPRRGLVLALGGLLAATLGALVGAL